MSHYCHDCNEPVKDLDDHVEDCPVLNPACKGCGEICDRDDLEDGLCPTCWEESVETELEEGGDLIDKTSESGE